MTKKELKKEILARRDALPADIREMKSKQIACRVFALDVFQKVDKIFLYSPIKSEVHTKEIFEEARKRCKEIYYPRVKGSEMEFFLVDETTEWEIGSYGIREPKAETSRRYVPSKEDELCIFMPGAVFDKKGNRIGYGGGYYDKYLQMLMDTLPDVKIHKIAQAYVCQLVPLGNIEIEAHDICVDCVVTEEDDGDEKFI